MLVDDIALTLQPEIGPKTAIHLIECFGSAEALFSASPEEMVGKGELKKELAQELVRKKFHKQAEKELGFLKKYNIHTLVSTSDDYPALLKECPDYPHVLYLQGDSSLLHRPMIAFAGTREASVYGKKMCRELVSGLAERLPDIVIVSGLSYGIDMECHRTALDCNVATLAVLPNGLTSIYPAHNTDLAREIIRRGGAVMTEFHSKFIPHSMVFLQRNRIVAGLTSGTVMVECPPGSGSLTTARLADDYERCLMAVPGRATDKNSQGTNNLIKRLKARMVCSADDILRELNWESRTVPIPEPETPQEQKTEHPGLGKDELGLLGYFNEHEIASVEELTQWSGLPPRELFPLLFNLEMAGILTTLPGNRYQKNLTMTLTDTHSHIYDTAFDDDREAVLTRAREAGVSRIFLPAIDSGSHEALFSLANACPEQCLPMIGLHPTSVNEIGEFHRELDLVEKLLNHPPVERFYAVGEVGLDLYWSKERQKEQEEAFRHQIDLALRHDLPLVIHTRDAWNEMLAILADYKGRGVRGVMHAFSGNREIYEAVKRCGDFLFGIGGVVTYKKSEIAALLPQMTLDDLVLETDSPYLTPVPYRGKRNESAYVALVCGKVAEIQELTPQQVAARTTANAARMFGF